MGQLRFLPTNIQLFWENNAKNSFFYDFEERKGREMEGKRVGERFSKELYKELIAYNWTEEEANSMAGNIDRLINDIIPYQTPQSYAELLNM